MKMTLLAAAGVVALAASALPAYAGATEADLGAMPKTVDVTLLNDGGKYVAIDLKHIDKGGTCRMDQDAVILRVGDGATAGTSRVRAMMPQIKSGGCPFMTEFEIGNDQFSEAQKSFVEKKEAAEKQIVDTAKQWGAKVEEALGGLLGSKPAPGKTETL